MAHTPSSRRSFLKFAFASAASLPIISAIGQASAESNPNKPVSSSDTMVVTLGYTSDATSVDAKKFPKYQAGQMCSNCVLYLEGGKTIEGTSGDYGRCGLFASGLVAAGGWCNSYAQKIEIPS